jgi:hypothetical protein
LSVENRLLTPDEMKPPTAMNNWMEETTAPRAPAGTISDWYVGTAFSVIPTACDLVNEDRVPLHTKLTK